MVLSAIPLAVAANVTRLMMIIFAGEIFGQEGGTYVRQLGSEHGPLSGGFFDVLIAHFLREDRGKERKRTVPDDRKMGRNNPKNNPKKRSLP